MQKGFTDGFQSQSLDCLTILKNKGLRMKAVFQLPFFFFFDGLLAATSPILSEVEDFSVILLVSPVSILQRHSWDLE